MRNVNLEENELTITAIFQQHTKEETIQSLKEALEVFSLNIVPSISKNNAAFFICHL